MWNFYVDLWKFKKRNKEIPNEQGEEMKNIGK